MCFMSVKYGELIFDDVSWSIYFLLELVLSAVFMDKF